MSDNSSLVHVFSGTEFTVNHLKDILSESGITSMVKNDFEAGKSAGFMGGTVFSIDLYIQEADKENADVIIEKFKLSLQK